MPSPDQGVHQLPTASLRTHPTLQLRALGTDRTTVQRYARAMREGDTFPPLEVAQVGKALYVIDGHHRLEAAQVAQLPKLPCNVTRMSLPDAQSRAFRANTKQGKQLTRRDKQAIFAEYLAQGRHLSPDGTCKPLRQIEAEIGRTYTYGRIGQLLRAQGIDTRGAEDTRRYHWSPSDGDWRAILFADPRLEMEEEQALAAFKGDLRDALTSYALLRSPEALWEARKAATDALDAITSSGSPLASSVLDI